MRERDLDLDQRQAEALGERGGCRGADATHPAAQDGDEISDLFEAFRRDPVAIDEARTAFGAQLIEEILPVADGWKQDQGEQRVVKLVWIANDGPGFLGNLRDGSWIQCADARGS